MNYTHVKVELLGVLRGDLTQMQLSRRLGFSFNQVGKWESGATQLKWSDFHDLCEVVGAPIDAALREVFLAIREDLRDSGSVLDAIRAFHSQMPYSEIARRLHCHVSVVRRWYSGAVIPDLESVFALMDLRKGFLPVFLAKLAPAERLPSLQARILADRLERERIAQDPAMITVQLCLRLEDYKRLAGHSDAFVAETAGIPLDEARERLERLESSGQIQWKDGRYVVRGGLSNLTGDPRALARIRRHWTERALSRFDVPDGVPLNRKGRPNFQSCLVFTTSRKEMVRIFDILNRCFEEIRQLESPLPEPEEEVRVLLMDFFSPDDAPRGRAPEEWKRPESVRHPSRL